MFYFWTMVQYSTKPTLLHLCCRNWWCFHCPAGVPTLTAVRRTSCLGRGSLRSSLPPTALCPGTPMPWPRLHHPTALHQLIQGYTTHTRWGSLFPRVLHPCLSPTPHSTPLVPFPSQQGRYLQALPPWRSWGSHPGWLSPDSARCSCGAGVCAGQSLHAGAERTWVGRE